MLRTGRICSWIGAGGALAGGAGLPVGCLKPATTAGASTVAPASLLGGLRLLGHQPAPPSPLVMQASLHHAGGLDGDRQQKPAGGVGAVGSMETRWGWRRAAAGSSMSSAASSSSTILGSPHPALARRAFGTGARSTGGSSADGVKEAGGKGKDDDDEEEGKVGKVRLMIKRYGPVAIVTYLGVYVTTLGLLFGAIEAGVNPFDYGVDSGNMVEKAAGMLEGYSWGKPVAEAVRQNPHMGNFALAWILTKFTEPLRAVLTIGIVPRIARALGRAPPLQR